MEIVFCSLKPDQVFGYNLFTYRENRGRTIAIILINILFQALKDNGNKEVLSLVALDNKPSLRSAYAGTGKAYLYGLRLSYSQLEQGILRTGIRPAIGAVVGRFSIDKADFSGEA